MLAAWAAKAVDDVVFVLFGAVGGMGFCLAVEGFLCFGAIDRWVAFTAQDYVEQI